MGCGVWEDKGFVHVNLIWMWGQIVRAMGFINGLISGKL